MDSTTRFIKHKLNANINANVHDQKNRTPRVLAVKTTIPTIVRFEESTVTGRKRLIEVIMTHTVMVTPLTQEADLSQGPRGNRHRSRG